MERGIVMNVLLVDDDRFVIAALTQKIDWASLMIDRVYTAFNIRQARKILVENPIDILISDIEMPQGSGLELLAWLRSEKYAVQAIFLTNYANFNYAQKAIELQSFDYYLKPIEFDKLTLIIKKAAGKVLENRRLEQENKAGQLWLNNLDSLITHFWYHYYMQKEDIPNEELFREISQKHLPYREDEQFLFLLVTLFPYSLTETFELRFALNQESSPDRTLYPLLRDVFSCCSLTLEAVLQCGPEREHFLLAGRICSSAQDLDLSLFGERIIRTLSEQLRCDSGCVIAEPCPITGFPTAAGSLEHMVSGAALCRGHVLLLSEFRPSPIQYRPPALEPFEECLYNKNPGRLLQKCEAYLNQQSFHKKLNPSVLINFRIDITQLVYTYLKQKGILAHKLFQDETFDVLTKESSRSLEDSMNYFTYLIHKSLDYVRFTTSRKSVAEIISAYIEQNYSSDISRSSLAEIVYLNPDHMARLFKKETGLSLGSYIIKKRIETAKRLLLTTDLPINSVSDQVGYDNYSYFTKLFKKITGYTPVDFRRKNSV